MRFGIIGSGSWATALAKILTDRKQPINWWIRNASTIEHIQKRRHNPHYLNTAEFNVSLLSMSGDISAVVKNSDVLVIAVPSAYVEQSLSSLDKSAFEGKKIVSAIKGLLPLLYRYPFISSSNAFERSSTFLKAKLLVWMIGGEMALKYCSRSSPSSFMIYDRSSGRNMFA